MKKIQILASVIIHPCVQIIQMKLSHILEPETFGNLKMERLGWNKRLFLHLRGLYAIVEPT